MLKKIFKRKNKYFINKNSLLVLKDSEFPSLVQISIFFSDLKARNILIKKCGKYRKGQRWIESPFILTAVDFVVYISNILSSSIYIYLLKVITLYLDNFVKI